MNQLTVYYCYYSIVVVLVLVVMVCLSRALDAFAGPSSRSAGAYWGCICYPATPIVVPPLPGHPSTYHMPLDARGCGCFSGLSHEVRWGGPCDRVTGSGERPLLLLLLLLLPLLSLLLSWVRCSDSCGKHLCFVFSAVRRETLISSYGSQTGNDKARLLPEFQ